MALVGILTSIDAVKNSLNDNFARMGANTLSIKGRVMKVEGSGADVYKAISYDDALAFKNRFEFPATVSVFSHASGMATLKYQSEKTNPNITLYGVDENYILTSGDKIEKGRNISANDILSGARVTVIGASIADKLFTNKQNPIGADISIGGGRYQVVGILESKGTSFGFNSGKTCLIPYSTLRNSSSGRTYNFTINIMTADPEMLERAEGEATGLFRIIRKVGFDDENNFRIEKSTSLADSLFENLKYLRLAAVIIGIITLVGAAIGLMNILLVSVTERTREIGIRKAIGANNSTIRNQFLVEAIVIAQLGGIMGIIFGILVGNILSVVLATGFVVPWAWILGGIALCFIVALLSGIIPAVKAAQLDPIESLRYE